MSSAAEAPAVFRVPWPERVMAALMAGCCLAVLVVAACLSPSPTGHGTHEQLGLSACGWVLAAGRPCPTCGMTTAFAAAAHGQWALSFRSQPFGMLLALAAAATFWGGLHVAVFGSRLGRMAARFLRPAVIWSVAALWAASWGYTLVTWKN